MKAARTLAAAAAALLLAACAATLPDKRLPAAATFDLLGRVLVSNEGRAFSSGFRWRHDADSDEIWLLSPVGQTLAHIAADAGGATLTTADQQTYQAASVEKLTGQALGWPLPLDRLQHWITADAVPGMAVAKVARDARSRVTVIEQADWRIRYVYPETGNDQERPRRLDMTRDGQQIRLVIDTWRGGRGL